MINRKPHNKYTPYKLECDSIWLGCYSLANVASSLGKAMVSSKEAKRYTVRDLNDNIVDQD